MSFPSKYLNANCYASFRPPAAIIVYNCSTGTNHFETCAVALRYTQVYDSLLYALASIVRCYMYSSYAYGESENRANSKDDTQP